MQVTHESDELLILDHRPWVMALILLGFLMVPVAGGVHVILTTEIPLFGVGVIVAGALFMLPFIYGFVQRRQVILDRREGRVTLRRRTIFGHRETIRDLSDLEGAEVETRPARQRDNLDTHRAVLRIGAETHPVSTGYASGAGAEQQANRINAWLGRGAGA